MPHMDPVILGVKPKDWHGARYTNTESQWDLRKCSSIMVLSSGRVTFFASAPIRLSHCTHIGVIVKLQRKDNGKCWTGKWRTR